MKIGAETATHSRSDRSTIFYLSLFLEIADYSLYGHAEVLGTLMGDDGSPLMASIQNYK